MTKLIRMVGTFLFTLTFCTFTLQAQELSLIYQQDTHYSKITS